MAAVRQMSIPTSSNELSLQARQEIVRRRSASPKRTDIMAVVDSATLTPVSQTISCSSTATSPTAISSVKKLLRRDTSSKLEASTSRSPTEEKSKSPKIHKAAGWKSSKFFSRTMTSTELLKGMKKISTTTSPTSSTAEDVIKPTMKKRNSASDTDVNKPRKSSPDTSLRKSSRESSDGSPASNSPRTSLDEGIVCKKEDILSLIHITTSKSSKGASPCKKISLKGTRSATIDPSGMSADQPASNDSNLPKIVATPPSSKKTALERTASDEPSKLRIAFNPESLALIQAKQQSEEEKQRIKAKRKQIKELLKIGVSSSGGSFNAVSETKDDKDGEEAKVKWDEGNVVDAVVLGDAIEAFLRGSMGSSQPKKVSFKKS